MYSGGNDVLNEQIKLIYRYLPAVIILPSLTALLLSGFFWGHIASSQIIIWLTLALALSGGTGCVLLILYRRLRHKITSTTFWSRGYNLLGILSGIAWGSSVYFLYTPEDAVLQLVLLLFLYFSIALVAISMNVYWPAFVFLATPVLLAIIIRFLLDPSRLHYLLTLATLFYGVTLFIFYFFTHRHFLRYMRISFEKNRLAEALQIRSDEAENENRAKSRFLAAASHDLRQPIVAQELLLTALIGNIGEEKYPEIFRNFKENIQALHALFNELVEVSRLDTGNVSFEIDYTDMEELFDEMQNQFSHQAASKNLQLTLMQQPEAIMSDSHLFKRILSNLISNAIKYTPTGDVKVYQQQQGNKILTIVEDSGVGIPEADQELIFDEFYRANNAGTYSDGFGLGLAIVKRLTGLLGHELKLESKLNKGTRITVIADAVPDYSDSSNIYEEPGKDHV